MRWKHAWLALGVALSFGCLRFPNEQAYVALDYRIDRPRVVGIKLTPPAVAHGLPVRVDALLLAPPGFEPEAVSVDLCGLRDDLLVQVWDQGCFNQPELVDHLATEVPFTWEPPDLSGVSCIEDTGFDTGPRDTGPVDTDPGDTDGADTDPGDTDDPYPDVVIWAEPRCSTIVPLHVGYFDGDERAYGELITTLRVTPHVPGEDVPVGIDAAARSLEVVGEVAAGNEVELVFRIEATDLRAFRWWIDAGELVGTGRTGVHSREEGAVTTANRLRIPEDWHGPLRVYVVAASDHDYLGRTGDLTWEGLTLEVP